MAIILIKTFNKIKSLCKNLFFFKSKFASNRDIINFINKKNLDFIIYSGYPGNT